MSPEKSNVQVLDQASPQKMNLENMVIDDISSDSDVKVRHGTSVSGQEMNTYRTLEDGANTGRGPPSALKNHQISKRSIMTPNNKHSSRATSKNGSDAGYERVNKVDDFSSMDGLSEHD